MRIEGGILARWKAAASFMRLKVLPRPPLLHGNHSGGCVLAKRISSSVEASLRRAESTPSAPRNAR
jgi:hypothetical protein